MCNKCVLSFKIADETREGGDDADETRLQTPREKITWQTKEDKGDD